jgi:hypothetical protein
MGRVDIRAIVEVRPNQDALESHPLALRMLSLGRLVDRTLTRGRAP